MLALRRLAEPLRIRAFRRRLLGLLGHRLDCSKNRARDAGSALGDVGWALPTLRDHRSLKSIPTDTPPGSPRRLLSQDIGSRAEFLPPARPNIVLAPP